MDKTMIRIEKNSNNPYTMINNRLLHDKNLSWKAKGILSYLLSLPDDWQVYESELVKHASDGADSLKSGINELVDNFYIHRTRLRDNKGRLGAYKYSIYEVPNHNGLSEVGNPKVGLSKVGKSAPTNKNLTNTNLTNTNSTNTSTKNSASNNAQPTSLNSKTQTVKDKSTPNKTDLINAFFEEVWLLYPNKKGKGQIKASKKVEMMKLGEELKRCINRYKEYIETERRNGFKELRFQIGSTFFNSGYVDYLDENYIEGESTNGTNTGNNKQGISEAAKREVEEFEQRAKERGWNNIDTERLDNINF